MTMSGHAATVNSSFVIFPLMVDWLHLLAAAFWIGGMLYIAIIYLPILRSCSLAEQAFSLTSVLPYYVPWALFGVGLIAMTGPLNTTFHLHSWAELLNTAYGRVLVVKILLVVGLLSTSAFHLLLLRPRLKKIYVQYVDAVAHGELDQGAASADGTRPPDRAASEPGATRVLLSQEGKQLESRLAKHTRTLTGVLRWEPLMGVGVLVCTGLLTLLAGTVPPAPVNSGQSATGSSRPFTTTVSTTDNKFTVTLTVTPNRFGTNVFTVSVLDSNGTQDTNVGVSLYTTFLDSEIGTTTINLQPDNKGHFSASGDLSMGGNWQIRIQIRTPDNTLHETTVNLFTAS
jgi:copper transport protein